MKPRLRSDGARQLGRLGLSDAAVAARLGCKPPQVSYWKTGERVPGAASRAKLERVLGIPGSAWDANVVEAPPRAPRPGRPPAPGIEIEVSGVQVDCSPVFGPPAAPCEADVPPREAETEEQRLLRLPSFVGLVARIVEALRPWAGAREAVIAALESSE